MKDRIAARFSVPTRVFRSHTVPSDFYETGSSFSKYTHPMKYRHVHINISLYFFLNNATLSVPYLNKTKPCPCTENTIQIKFARRIFM